METSKEHIQVLVNTGTNMAPYYFMLYEEAKKVNSIIEFGVYRGKSTRCLLFGLKEGEGGHLLSVDWGISRELQEIAIPEIERLELSSFWTLVLHDANTLPYKWFEDNKVDMILIDLDRLTDFNLLLDKCGSSLNLNGKIFMHNTIVFSEVKTAIQTFLKGHPNYEYSELSVQHGLGILIKK